MEYPLGEDGDLDLGEIIEDKDIPDPQESIDHDLLSKELEKQLSALDDPRIARVLKLRNGLVDGKIYTLKEVGKELGVSRERVRQLESQGKRQLRNPLRSKKLIEYS